MMRQRSICLRLLLLLGGWLHSTAMATTSVAAASTTTTLSIVSKDDPNQQSIDASPNRNLAIYALYNIPPFAVTFSTQPTTELLNALEGNSALLSETGERDSELSYPIRSVTETFLLERFQLELAELYASNSDKYSPIYSHLMAVDMQTKLYVTSIDSESMRQRRRAASEVTLIAEMYGTLAFLEPEDKSVKPSNDDVKQLFGGWLEETFTNHRDQYLRELVQSDQDLLREISSLEIETNIDNNSWRQSSYAEGWSSRTERALLVMLVLMALMGAGWMILYLRQRHKHRMISQYHDDDEDGFITRNSSFSSDNIPRPSALTGRERMSSMDAVRHGSDTYHRNSQTGAMSILESTDRYLSKHRPDLYQQAGANTAEFSVFGRTYSIPSNPFEKILPSFSDTQQPSEPFGSPRGAFTPRASEGRRNSIEIQRENIASIQEHLEDSFEEDYANRVNNNNTGIVYRPIASIWRNLSGMWEDVKSQQQQQQTDGLVFYSQDQESDFEQEEAAEYDFAFKDFPRHDGTPCLIYKEDDQEEEKKRIFVIGSHDEDDDIYTDDPEIATTPVSNFSFQRMLSQQSLNCSFDDVAFDDAPAKSPAFKEKLDRLVQQKKRQYEKKAIVEKHREKKAKERKNIREKERRERHKAMEKEIQSIEATFKSPLERSWALQMSPKVHSQYSPKPARPFSPSRSPARSKQHTFRQAFSPYKNNDLYIKTSNSWTDGESAIKQSPGYRSAALSPKNGGSVFRPAPKTSYLDDEAPNGSSRSNRSISPLRGIEDKQPFSLRPRSTKKNPDLQIDTLYGNSSMDSKMMNKLSMPPMISGDMGNPKYPSPQSVMDEALYIPPQPKRHIGSHRRVSSFSHPDDEDIIRAAPLPPRNNVLRTPQTHRRSNSQNGQKDQRGQHRRSDSQSSHSEDIFLHGIVTQARFV